VVWAHQAHAAAVVTAGAAAVGHLQRHARVGGGHAAASSLRRRGAAAAGDGTQDDESTCSCDCCAVVDRRPDEVVAGAAVKCAPAEGHSSDVCSEQCVPAEEDHVLRDSAEDEVLDYQRYCFFECKPAAGITSLVGTQCVMLEPSEAQRVVDPSGNAVDPAVVYARPAVGGPVIGGPYPNFGGQAMPWPVAQPAALLTATKALTRRGAFAATNAGRQSPEEEKAEEEGESGGPAKPGSPEAAQEAADKGIERAKAAEFNARAEATTLRTGEAVRSGQLMGRLRATHGTPMPEGAEVEAGDGPEGGAAASAGGGVDPYAAVADIRASAASSRDAANRAGKAAKSAVEAYKEARQVNWAAAVDTTEIEMERLRADVRAEEKRAAEAPETWQQRAVKATKQASKPYLDALMSAQYTAHQYTTRAQEAAARALDLDSKSKEMAQRANELNRLGKRSEAEVAIYEAREVARQAQDQSKAAKEFYASAGKAAATAPTYYREAKEAAANAAANLKLPWPQDSGLSST